MGWVWSVRVLNFPVDLVGRIAIDRPELLPRFDAHGRHRRPARAADEHYRAEFCPPCAFRSQATRALVLARSLEHASTDAVQALRLSERLQQRVMNGMTK